ncbi:MAG: type VI secretion system tube protein Hcp [Proteobacteria bacterium]|nr:type VI secretion system tube protein Hcp [Pseudomonadota bacterium]
MGNNVNIVLQSSQASLLAGNVATTGYTNAVRVESFPAVIIKNPFRPTRSGNRNLTNPGISPITVIAPFGSVTPMAFQALCNGNNVGTITITELISDGKTAQTQRVLVLTNVYLIEWAMQGDRDGGLCSFTMTFDSLKQTRSSIGQNQKAAGKTSASTNINTSATG